MASELSCANPWSQRQETWHDISIISCMLGCELCWCDVLPAEKLGQIKSSPIWSLKRDSSPNKANWGQIGSDSTQSITISILFHPTLWIMPKMHVNYFTWDACRFSYLQFTSSIHKSPPKWSKIPSCICHTHTHTHII